MLSGNTASRVDTRSMLAQLNNGAFSVTAYDTAWVACVPEGNDASSPAFPEALNWLRRNQNLGGSWGSKIEYYHDRVISTLAALIALAEHGDDPRDDERIWRGESYIHYGMKRLHFDPYETVGFELILPTLMERAQKLELNLPYHECESYERIRDAKLQMIPDELVYSSRVTTTHSLEFMGNMLDVERCEDIQEENGSCGNSPSATAYFLTRCPDNHAARNYLDGVLQAGGGAAMPAHPIEIFNKSWVLYNVELAGLLENPELDLGEHLDYLYQVWDPEKGVGFSSQYSVADLDDTAVVFKLLRLAGYDVDPAVFELYERDDHFACYPYERNPSIGAHIHLLDALRVCPEFEGRSRMIEKTLAFLYRTRRDRAYWYDKWHISPYYITAHAVIAAIGCDDQLARSTVRWILETQRYSGAWGHYAPGNEETAYCLQALVTYHQNVEPLARDQLDSAARYLYTHRNQNFQTLWIEKCLYTPTQIVQSAISSALIMYENL